MVKSFKKNMHLTQTMTKKGSRFKKITLSTPAETVPIIRACVECCCAVMATRKLALWFCCLLPRY